MSFWRRLLGFDPASKDGGVVSLGIHDDGRMRIDLDQLQASIDASIEHAQRHMLPGMTSFAQDYEYRAQPLTPMYKPKEKQLADKENKQPVLHLDDYQPRDTEHPAFRMHWERSFPAPPPMTLEEVDRRYTNWAGRTDPHGWAHYRNRHPGIRDFALGTLPPMRDAMADLLLFLAEVNEDLQRRDLVAVELGVSHEPAEQVGQERQGWHYRVDALVVPSAVLVTEQERFEELQAKLTKKDPADEH